MAVPNPQVAIGDLNIWHDLEVVTAQQRPKLDADGARRPLLPGAIGYRYWTVTVGLPGGIEESVTGRLLLHNAAANPPPAAVLVVPGSHSTYIRVIDTPEADPVKAGYLEAKP